MDYIMTFMLIAIDMLLGIGFALAIRRISDIQKTCREYEQENNYCLTAIKAIQKRENANDLVTNKLADMYTNVVKNSDDLKHWAYSNVATWKTQTHGEMGFAIDSAESISKDIETMLEQDRAVDEFMKARHAAESDSELDPIVAEEMIKGAKHAKPEEQSNEND